MALHRPAARPRQRLAPPKSLKPYRGRKALDTRLRVRHLVAVPEPGTGTPGCQPDERDDGFPA